MQLHIIVTDLAGNGLAKIEQYEGLEATDPLCDSRTARLTVSVYDPAAAMLKPLSRGLKIVYGDALIFNGIIMQPLTDFAAGTIEVVAHDPTIKLKQHHHRYGDIVVDVGFPADGRGMRRIIESSIPMEPQLDRGVIGNHILWGIDDTTHQAAQGENNPDGTKAIWRRVQRGDNVWDSLRNIQQTLIGPDFRFRPVDADHPGIDGPPPTGFMVEFDTFDRMINDRTDTVVFQCGFGADNAEGVTHEPDGSSTRNYFVQVNPGGDHAPADDKNRQLFHDEASWLEVGIYMGWESSGVRDSPELLAEKAKAWVKAYATPPDFCTVVPRIDAPGVPVYARDFQVGDVIRVQARRGWRELDTSCRVINATVRQEDPAGNTRVALDCVPNLDPIIDEGDN